MPEHRCLLFIHRPRLFPTLPLQVAPQASGHFAPLSPVNNCSPSVVQLPGFLLRGPGEQNPVGINPCIPPGLSTKVLNKDVLGEQLEWFCDAHQLAQQKAQILSQLPIKPAGQLQLEDDAPRDM